jgi:glutathione synthase/RimK-type ligase-like ATP-grasp enzyme
VAAGCLPDRVSARPATAVAVGSRGDEHLRAVADRLDQTNLAIFDAATLPDERFTLRSGVMQLGDLRLSVEVPARGWLRRLAPPDWQHGVVLESHGAAVKTSWLALLVSVTRTCGVRWLTELDALVSAENKIVQCAAATALGIATPETIVTNDPAELREALPEEFVVKPLGPGHFYEGDEALVVYSTVLRKDSPELEVLGAAPFIAQRKLQARRHLRVVTVRDQVWVASIEAADWPLDWREAAGAHSAFALTEPPSEVAKGSLALAGQLKLGYSSQDWLLCEDGCYVIDVNPAGQWLFLPEPIAGSVAAAIAGWLGSRLP